MDYIKRAVSMPPLSFFDFFPLRLCASIGNFCQFVAILKCCAANCDNAATYCHVCQTGTIREGTIINTNCAVRNDNTCQALAFVESFKANTIYNIRKAYSRQTGTLLESSATNSGQLAIRPKCHSCQSFAIKECPPINRGYAIRYSDVC